MLFRTHILFGFFLWLILIFFLKVPFFILGFILFGSIFLDIDSHNSKIGSKFWFLSWFFKHRGFLHSLFGCLFLGLIIGLLNLWAGFGFFLGGISHLFLDSFTKRGVRIFWPFGFKVYGFVKTGSWMEDVLFVLLLFFDFSLCFYHLFH